MIRNPFPETFKWTWSKTLANILALTLNWGVTKWLTFNSWLINSTPKYKDGKQNCYPKLGEQPSSPLFCKLCLSTPSHVLKYQKQFVTKWTLLLEHSGGVMNREKENFIFLTWTKYVGPWLFWGGGGLLGLKKFSLIDQAMLVKQFWRISHHPNFLLARTFKAKYFPRGSIQDCTPKPINLGFEEVSLNLRTPNSKKEDGGLAKAVMFHSIIKIGSKFPLKTWTTPICILA